MTIFSIAPSSPLLSSGNCPSLPCPGAVAPTPLTPSCRQPLHLPVCRHCPLWRRPAGGAAHAAASPGQAAPSGPVACQEALLGGRAGPVPVCRCDGLFSSLVLPRPWLLTVEGGRQQFVHLAPAERTLTSQPGHGAPPGDSVRLSPGRGGFCGSSFVGAAGACMCPDAQVSSGTPATLLNISADKNFLNVQPDVQVDKVLKASD